MTHAQGFSHAEYDKIVEETIEQIRELSALKGGEYAGDYDRLANFRRNADNCGVPMELIWRIYAGKHWDAITTYINDVVNHKDRPRLESLAGRANDLIVYLILFKCMLFERESDVSSSTK
jgi:hypothetical protein